MRVGDEMAMGRLKKIHIEQVHAYVSLALHYLYLGKVRSAERSLDNAKEWCRVRKAVR
jgi:hypothetical protein